MCRAQPRLEQLQPLAAQRALHHDETGGVAAGPREACDEAAADRIGKNRENVGMVRVSCKAG
jgi:hypothetical protein